jgi:hypothetical protein
MSSMYTKAPNQLPPLSAMIESIPGASDLNLLAKHLGVSPKQITGWKLAGEAPRSVMLALFWETKWGVSVIDCDARTSVKRWYALAQSSEREIASLRARVARLEALGSHGSANSPLWDNDYPIISIKKA